MKRKFWFKQLLFSIEQAGNVGGWWLNLQDNKLIWTDGTRFIHEVEPDFQPDVASALAFYQPPYDMLIKQAVETALQSGKPYSLKAKIKTATGQEKWVHTAGYVSYQSDGEPGALYGSFRDITAETEEVNRRLLESDVNQTVVDSLVEGLITIKSDGTILSFNKAAENIFKYKKHQVIGKPVELLMPEPHRIRHDSYIKNYERTGEAKIIGIGREVEGRKSDGTIFPLHLSVNKVSSQHEASYIGTLRDLSREKEVINKLEWLSHYDELTGLPNRTFILNYLANKLAAGSVTLFAIDLDYFSKINLTHGFDEGNVILKTISDRLLQSISDLHFVGKDIADRFWVVLEQEQINDGTALNQKLLNLLQVIAQPVDAPLAEHFLTASIGVAVGLPGSSASSLLSHAEAALYCAKQKGRNQICYYEQNLSSSVISEYQIERELRAALRNNELQCWLQPKANRQHKIVSAEVLIRWIKPDGSFIPPDQFISVAEKMGLINKVGHYVAQQTAKMLAQINAQHADFSLAMNVSPKEFMQQDFVSNLQAAFTACSANMNNLTIEITENLLLNDEQLVNKTMDTLAALGISFSIDDFGTGYSNLKRIMDIPLTELKIDKQFIMNICDDERSFHLAKAIVNMAKAMQYRVVAEGVESERIARQCIDLGIDILQGYHFSKPVPFNVFKEKYFSEPLPG